MAFLESVLGLAYRTFLLGVTCFLWLLRGSKKNKIPAIRDPLLLEPAIVLAAKIRSRKIKSETVVKAYVDRIRAVNPVINAVVEDRFEAAIQEAKAADHYILTAGKTPETLAQEKPFLGVPFSSKEIVAVQGMSLTSGVVYRKGIKASEDCAAVTLMRSAGAIPICVTNVPELCLFLDASNKLHGTTKNPFDLNKVPGGSSGGECALISSAGSVIGVGTDLGGSIRVPAFCCGIFGHKPTRKMVSNRGQFPSFTESELDQYKVTGPLCRYAADLLPMMKVLAGNNLTKLRLDNKVELKNVKVYYTENYMDGPLSQKMSDDISLAVRKVVLHLSKTYGCTTKRVSLPALNHSSSIFHTKLSNLNMYNVVGELVTGKKAGLNVWWELVKWIFRMSEHTLNFLVIQASSLFYSSKMMKMVNAKNHESFAGLTQDLHQLLGQDGVFIYPTTAGPATFHEDQLLKFKSMGYTGIFNLLGYPVTQCPTGTTWQGMPIGVQVVSNLYNDRLTLTVAKELEVLYGGWSSPAPIL